MTDPANSLEQWNRFWRETLLLIRDNETIIKNSYNTWLEPLDVVDFKNQSLFLDAHNYFIRDWVDNNYKDLIQKYLRKHSNGSVAKAVIVVTNPDGTYSYTKEDEEEELKTPAPPTPERPFVSPSIFNPKYTFDSFVVGDNNRFAHAAAMAVAEAPGRGYNPMLFFGGVGLGKTHLMQAIGNFITENDRQSNVGYFSSEQFINEWITAIRHKTTEEFQKKYRNYDALLIDDIQFFEGKDSCQEEFFHTFNALYEGNKQIVLSADRPLNEIANLEDRLISRFSGGLTTELMPPNLETRIAILKNKAKNENIYVQGDEPLFYIANRVDSNIRALEGALNRVVAFAKINGSQITLELTAKALENIVAENKRKPITVESIQQVTAQYFHIRIEDLKGSKRNNSIAFPRQIAMYLCRQFTDLTFQEIGTEFGNRHHSTVMHAQNEIEKQVSHDIKTKKYVEEITNLIKKM
ncbi:MAG TPA: chromosomal replication initiator protein DnaA [Firmicutes bacterium]|nr:chromosomal replication initiator protein DnaA [Bacillota bacterium]